MSTQSDKQNSSTVAHEAEDVRASLAHTLEQLRNNLKPEHMMEEVVGNARIGADTLTDGLLSLAKAHPMPALLIGAGCAFVLSFGGQKKPGKQSVIELSPNGAGPRRNGSDRVAWDVGNTAGRVPLTHGPIGIGREPTVLLSFQATRQDTSMNSSGGFKGSRLSDIFHEQPLIIAALGVAVGAAIGAILPTTRVENDWMGETSASIKSAAQDVARSELDELRTVASRTAENLKQTAADHGMSRDNISGLVHDVGEQAKSTIHDVGGTV